MQIILSTPKTALDLRRLFFSELEYGPHIIYKSDLLIKAVILKCSEIAREGIFKQSIANFEVGYLNSVRRDVANRIEKLLTPE